MTEVDVSSTNQWPSVLEELNITKPVNELQSLDILGKALDSLDKWEVFYHTYSKWIGFSVRMDDVKRRGDLITMRRWVCSKEGYRRDKFVNNPDRQKRPKPITRTGCQAALRVVLCNESGHFIAKEFAPEHNHGTYRATIR